MSEKTQFIILFCFLIMFLIELIHFYIDSRRPRYMKPKSFFKMHDNETGILAYTAEHDVQVTHHYAESLFAKSEDVEK